MIPRDIAAELKKAGSSQAEIARETGFSLSAINSVIYQRPGNKSNNLKIRLAIADKLRLPINYIFKDHCNNTSIDSKVKKVNGKP